MAKTRKRYLTFHFHGHVEDESVGKTVSLFIKGRDVPLHSMSGLAHPKITSLPQSVDVVFQDFVKRGVFETGIKSTKLLDALREYKKERRGKQRATRWRFLDLWPPGHDMNFVLTESPWYK